MDATAVGQALAISIVTLGESAGEATLQETGKRLREALHDHRLRPGAVAILEAIVAGIDYRPNVAA